MHEMCLNMAETLKGGNSVIYILTIKDQSYAENIKKRLLEIGVDAEYKTINAKPIFNEYGEIVDIKQGEKVLSGYSFRLREEAAS